jgi:hypothetical protein
MLLDWRRPIGIGLAEPAGLEAEPALRGSWDTILACDVLYDRDGHQGLLDAVAELLAPQGECWIGDPGRMNLSEQFGGLATRNGFAVLWLDRAGCGALRPIDGEFRVLVLSRSRTGGMADTSSALDRGSREGWQ